MKKLIALAVSALLLLLIWRQVDGAAVKAAIAASDGWILAAGLAMVVPLTIATSVRFKILANGAVSNGDALRLILSASSLNLVLPSKMGDLAKSVVLVRRHAMSGSLAVSLVMLEKMLDMASLLLWGVIALLWLGVGSWLYAMLLLIILGGLTLLSLLIAPGGVGARLLIYVARLLPARVGAPIAGFLAEWRAMLEWFWSSKRRALGVIGLSIVTWLGHLAQFWLFARALGAAIGFIDNMAAATLSILVGLLPFTFAGVGTRDAAILFFYAPWLDAGACVILGVLAFLRYVLPALAGLPFMGDYLDRKDAP